MEVNYGLAPDDFGFEPWIEKTALLTDAYKGNLIDESRALLDESTERAATRGIAEQVFVLEGGQRVHAEPDGNIVITSHQVGGMDLQGIRLGMATALVNALERRRIGLPLLPSEKVA